jgi:hypothetical protein
MNFFSRLFGAGIRRVTRLPKAPQVPAWLSHAVQLEHHGFGKKLGRQYTLYLDSELTPEALCALVARHITALSPESLAAFEKTNGSIWGLRLGDEFEITMLGPWNGRVRVIEASSTSFGFVTLRGHPEAGRIRFAVVRDGSGRLRFQITSWATARNLLVYVAYGILGKRIQTEVWTTFLERVAELTGCAPLEPISLAQVKEEE